MHNFSHDRLLIDGVCFLHCQIPPIANLHRFIIPRPVDFVPDASLVQPGVLSDLRKDIWLSSQFSLEQICLLKWLKFDFLCFSGRNCVANFFIQLTDTSGESLVLGVDFIAPLLHLLRQIQLVLLFIVPDVILSFDFPVGSTRRQRFALAAFMHR